MGHVRAVLSLCHSDQDRIIKEAISKKLSVRAVESIVRKKSLKPTKVRAVDNDTVILERKMSESLCANVTVSHSKSGKGKITIFYKSLAELDGIVKKFK